MKLMLITPVSHLWMTHLLPGRFCLANIAIRYPAYGDWFMHEQKNGKKVMLDNGVFEDANISEAEYISLTLSMEPSVVVAPDVIGRDAQENYQAALTFVASIEKALEAQTETLCPHTEVMFVPQTKRNDVAGFGEVIDLFIKEPKLQILGICRDACYNAFGELTHTKDQELNRFYFGIWMQKTGLLPSLFDAKKRIHFLGIGDQIHMLQHYWYVSSADTASFFWQGTQGNIITENGMLPTTFKRPRGYFTRTFKHLDQDELYSTVELNCNKAQFWVQKAIDYRNDRIGGRL